MARSAIREAIFAPYLFASLLIAVGLVAIQASDTHGTPLTVVAPYQWLLLNSPLESAQVRAACIRGDHLMALVGNWRESEVVEVSATGEILFRRQFPGRYEDLAANSQGEWALLKGRAATGKSVIESFNADGTPRAPVETAAIKIAYLNGGLYGREGDEFIRLADRTQSLRIPLSEDAVVQSITMPDGSALFLDLLTARFARPAGPGQPGIPTFLHSCPR